MHYEKPIPQATSLAPGTETAVPSCLDFYYYFLKDSHIKILAQRNSLQVNSFHAVCEGNTHHRNTRTTTQEGILPLAISAPLIPFLPPPAFFQRDGLRVTPCDVNGYFVLITGIKSPDRIYLQLSTLSYNKLMDDSSFSPSSWIH